MKKLLLVSLLMLLVGCSTATPTPEVITVTEIVPLTPTPTNTPVPPTEEPLPECWGLYGQITELVTGHPDARYDWYVWIRLTNGDEVSGVALTVDAQVGDFVNLEENYIRVPSIVEVCELN